MITLLIVITILFLYAFAEHGSWMATKQSRRGRTDFTVEACEELSRRASRWPFRVEKGFYCFSCKTELRRRDMIPIFSYLRYKGKCRYCSTPIDPVHFKYEVAGGAIGLATGITLSILLTLMVT